MNQPTIINPPNTELSPRSAAFNESISLGEWQSIGCKFGECSDGLKFWIGDWFNLGSKLFPGHAQQSLDLIGLDPCMVRECSLVSKRIRPARRSTKLGYGHHQAIAAEAKPAHQLELLKLAEDEHMTVPQLRKHIRWKYAQCPPASDSSATDFVIHAELTKWQRWKNHENFKEWKPERKAAVRDEVKPLISLLLDIWEDLKE